MPNRVSYIIDGFNLYHSVKDASRHLGLSGTGTKWLNIRSVCESFLPQVGTDALLSEIHYFSALATHIDRSHPEVTKRHKLFIRCLQDTGIHVHLSRFKEKHIYCRRCNHNITRFEEKETDVALAAKLFEILADNSCDTVLVMTGDTDITPAIKTAQHMYKNQKSVGLIFPFKRKSKELAKMVSYSFNLKPNAYQRHQFPPQVTLSDGTVISKPHHW